MEHPPTPHKFEAHPILRPRSGHGSIRFGLGETQLGGEAPGARLGRGFAGGGACGRLGAWADRTEVPNKITACQLGNALPKRSPLEQMGTRSWQKP